ncbi:unnamed protein product [Amoebophrya sp. A25]|nr:unnamed protein product [Amoebophrya sp. A25]|eukprot:GSA25T00003395001.1
MPSCLPSMSDLQLVSTPHQDRFSSSPSSLQAVHTTTPTIADGARDLVLAPRCSTAILTQEKTPKDGMAMDVVTKAREAAGPRVEPAEEKSLDEQTEIESSSSSVSEREDKLLQLQANGLLDVDGESPVADHHLPSSTAHEAPAPHDTTTQEQEQEVREDGGNNSEEQEKDNNSAERYTADQGHDDARRGPYTAAALQINTNAAPDHDAHAFCAAAAENKLEVQNIEFKQQEEQATDTSEEILEKICATFTPHERLANFWPQPEATRSLPTSSDVTYLPSRSHLFRNNTSARPAHTSRSILRDGGKISTRTTTCEFLYPHKMKNMFACLAPDDSAEMTHTETGAGKTTINEEEVTPPKTPASTATRISSTTSTASTTSSTASTTSIATACFTTMAREKPKKRHARDGSYLKNRSQKVKRQPSGSKKNYNKQDGSKKDPHEDGSKEDLVQDECCGSSSPPSSSSKKKMMSHLSTSLFLQFSLRGAFPGPTKRKHNREGEQQELLVEERRLLLGLPLVQQVLFNISTSNIFHLLAMKLQTERRLRWCWQPYSSILCSARTSSRGIKRNYVEAVQMQMQKARSKIETMSTNSVASSASLQRVSTPKVKVWRKSCGKRKNVTKFSASPMQPRSHCSLTDVMGLLVLGLLVSYGIATSTGIGAEGDTATTVMGEPTELENDHQRYVKAHELPQECPRSESSQTWKTGWIWVDASVTERGTEHRGADGVTVHFFDWKNISHKLGREDPTSRQNRLAGLLLAVNDELGSSDKITMEDLVEDLQLEGDGGSAAARAPEVATVIVKSVERWTHGDSKASSFTDHQKLSFTRYGGLRDRIALALGGKEEQVEVDLGQLTCQRITDGSSFARNICPKDGANKSNSFLLSDVRRFGLSSRVTCDSMRSLAKTSMERLYADLCRLHHHVKLTVAKSSDDLKVSLWEAQSFARLAEAAAIGNQAAKKNLYSTKPVVWLRGSVTKKENVDSFDPPQLRLVVVQKKYETNLGEWILKPKRKAGDVFDALNRAASSVQYYHDMGYVHRKIHPRILLVHDHEDASGGSAKAEVVLSYLMDERPGASEKGMTMVGARRKRFGVSVEGYVSTKCTRGNSVPAIVEREKNGSCNPEHYHTGTSYYTVQSGYVKEYAANNNDRSDAQFVLLEYIDPAAVALFPPGSGSGNDEKVMYKQSDIWSFGVVILQTLNDFFKRRDPAPAPAPGASAVVEAVYDTLTTALRWNFDNGEDLKLNLEKWSRDLSACRENASPDEQLVKKALDAALSDAVVLPEAKANGEDEERTKAIATFLKDGLLPHALTCDHGQRDLGALIKALEKLSEDWRTTKSSFVEQLSFVDASRGQSTLENSEAANHLAPAASPLTRPTPETAPGLDSQESARQPSFLEDQDDVATTTSGSQKRSNLRGHFRATARLTRQRSGQDSSKGDSLGGVEASSTLGEEASS